MRGEVGGGVQSLSAEVSADHRKKCNVSPFPTFLYNQLEEHLKLKGGDFFYGPRAAFPSGKLSEGHMPRARCESG